MFGPAVLVVIALGVIALVGEMAWSVWRLHAFTPLFWALAWIVIVVCLLLRSQTKPLPGLWNTAMLWFGIATAVTVLGWLASPKLNSWLRS